MKKNICLIIATLFIVNIAFCQNVVQPTCNCVVPTNGSCNSTCTFSDCCVCYNPNTQNAGCGCYWGVATCKVENTSTTNSLASTNFGEVNPNAKISFSFEKFSLLFSFFKSKNIRTDVMENMLEDIKSNYSLTGQKVAIDNGDFAKILFEYSTLIDRLNADQKNDLNRYIKSIN